MRHRSRRPIRALCRASGKVRHDRRQSALDAAREASEGSRAVADLRIYKCPSCRDWHFTSKAADPISDLVETAGRHGTRLFRSGDWAGSVFSPEQIDMLSGAVS